MIRSSEQVLHLVVSINHVLFSRIDVVCELLNANVLTFDLCVEVLCLVLGRFDYSNNLLKLVILIFEHVLLQTKYLAVVKVACLVKLAIFAPRITLLVLGSGQSSLTILDGAILLREITVD